MEGSIAIKMDRAGRGAGPLCGLVLALWAGVAGCRQSDSLPNLKVYEVKGKVLLADGKPLTNGWVYFVPKGELTVTPSAIIGSDGTFSLITGGSGEGGARPVTTKSASKHRDSSRLRNPRKACFRPNTPTRTALGSSLRCDRRQINWNHFC